MPDSHRRGVKRVRQGHRFSAASTSGSPTSYSVYRGTKSDGEAITPIGTTNGTTTTFTDTGVSNGTTYFYAVAANNGVGVSPDSNEVSTTPSSSTGGGSNLALGKPTTASSVENAGAPASNATDGNTGTRWSSAFSDPQWLQVDLGATHSIDQVVLQWEAAYAKTYQIQTSNDGTTWTPICSTTTGTGAAGGPGPVLPVRAGELLREVLARQRHQPAGLRLPVRRRRRPVLVHLPRRSAVPADRCRLVTGRPERSSTTP
ncbi:MAG: coagulation factor 5/8 type domain protein [Actinomycetia bacterium]|nr:coagulation factor 5/8 type domain protein [Actinomycetes bacterium]